MTTTCATCPTCELGLHHCHAIVARHDDGAWTCLDWCGGPLAVHDDVAGCDELGLGCCPPHSTRTVDAEARPPFDLAATPRAA